MNKYQEEFLRSQIRSGNNSQAEKMKRARERERRADIREKHEAERVELQKERSQYQRELESGLLTPDGRREAQSKLKRILDRIFELNKQLGGDPNTQGMFNTQETLL